MNDQIILLAMFLVPNWTLLLLSELKIVLKRCYVYLGKAGSESELLDVGRSELSNKWQNFTRPKVKEELRLLRTLILRLKWFKS